MGHLEPFLFSESDPEPLPARERLFDLVGRAPSPAQSPLAPLPLGKTRTYRCDYLSQVDT